MSGVSEYFDDFDRAMIASGVFTRRTYTAPKTLPEAGYTPAQHCKEFGHTWYSAGEIEDHCGEAKEFSQCSVCGETNISYSFD